jgi:hypothetical protein
MQVTIKNGCCIFVLQGPKQSAKNIRLLEFEMTVNAAAVFT